MGYPVYLMEPIFEIQQALSILAGQVSEPWLDIATAANLFAHTSGLDMDGALSVACGPVPIDRNASTSFLLYGATVPPFLDTQAALSQLAWSVIA